MQPLDITARSKRKRAVFVCYWALFFQLLKLSNTSFVIRVPLLYEEPPYTPFVWTASEHGPLQFVLELLCSNTGEPLWPPYVSIAYCNLYVSEMAIGPECCHCVPVVLSPG